MREYEEKLKNVINESGIEAEHLSFDQYCRSVAEAAKTVGADPDDFIKSICMIDREGNTIVAIVKGEDRASTSRVAKALGIDRPKLASPQEILGLTGFPVGGTPGFGFKAVFLMDPRVLEKEFVYSGGGSECSLVRMSTKEMLQANNGRVVRVRK
jgi:prolyl-tRNA editing enzyme YbaK/EbsC (Cys-tRNA(Pro) deacylase)